MTASVIVGATEYQGWTRYEIDCDLLTPCDAFNFEVGELGPDLLIAALPGQAVTVRLDGETLLVGRLDEARARYGASESTLQLLGRDRAGALVDCSAHRGWTIKGRSLTAIASDILAYLGISAAVEGTGAALDPIGQGSVNMGESCWELIDRLSRQQQVLAWFTPAGNLSLAAPVESGTVSYTFQCYRDERKTSTNVLAGDVEWNIADRYSDVTVVGQQADFLGDSYRPSATERDSEVVALGLYRPLTLSDMDATTQAAAQRRAFWEVGRRRAECLSLSYTVAGHQQDGRLIMPNRLAQVTDQRFGIDDTYLITGVRYSKSISEGTRTRVTLRRKGALLGLPDAVKAGEGLF